MLNFNPKTAFGNNTLIKVLQEEERQATWEAAIKACGKCDNKGNREETCMNCGGTGEVKHDCEDCSGEGFNIIKCEGH